MFQSPYFPIPLITHIIFTAAAIIFLIISFFHKKYLYKLIFAADIACTFIIYTCKTQSNVNTLGILEFIVFVIVIIVRYIEIHRQSFFVGNNKKGEHYR